MLLRWGAFPATESQDTALGRLVQVENIDAWIRVPDGSIVPAEIRTGQDTVVASSQPQSLGDVELPNGVYVLGMRLDAGLMDIDSNGQKERVFFYANALTSRYSRDGQPGTEPGVFFRHDDKVALEIGPVTAPTGRRGLMATGQTALQENELQVLFRGQPLPNAQVNALSDTGWMSQLTTDENGVLRIVPVGRRAEGSARRAASSQSLYTVMHKVEKPGELDGVSYLAEYHIASLLMEVRMPGPEWKSKSEGFRLATTSVVGFLLLAGAFGIYRRRKRAAQVMVEFDRHDIRRGEV